MKKLLGLAFFVLILWLVYSVGGALWRAMNFDSQVSGYVQNAIGTGPDEIRANIMQLVAENGIDVVEGSLIVIPSGRGHEVQLRYRVPLGLGGFVYVWEKSCVARTRFGGSVRLQSFEDEYSYA